MSTNIIGLLLVSIFQLFVTVSFRGTAAYMELISEMNMEKNNDTSVVNVTVLDKNPFEGMKISENWKMLSLVKGRTMCPKCKKSRKYFCYTCYIAVTELKDIVPKVKLPLKVDIIKHAHEIDGKSTAAHAATLAPDDVTVYTYPSIPDYSPDENIVLVFPGKKATTLKEAIQNMMYEDKHKFQTPQSVKNTTDGYLPITRAVFIDSTWNQCKGIHKDPKLQALPCVVLTSRLSQFWRHQNGSPRWYLATIEAIHQFLVDLHSCRYLFHSQSNGYEDNEHTSVQEVSNYNGEYDNLLFFFRFMYEKIHTLYDHDLLYSYKRPMNI